MSRSSESKTKTRRLSWRGIVSAIAIYVIGLAVTVFGVDNEIVRYAGYVLIGIGSLATAMTVIDGLISISTAIKVASVLAIIGIIAYVIWSGYTAQP